MATKKTTPGKGGAKGMHHGHAYKETCKCAICTSKRKKLNAAPPVFDPFVKPPFNKVMIHKGDEGKPVPKFERKEFPAEYHAIVTYPGINPDNTKIVLDTDKKEVFFDIDGYKKVFPVPELDQDATMKILHTFSGDVLTVMVARVPVPLTNETAHLFSKDEPVKVEHNAPEETKNSEPEKSNVAESGTKENPVFLSGEIEITEETYGVMNVNGVKLARAFNLQKGFDHGKFINDLTNRAIVFYCLNLK